MLWSTDPHHTAPSPCCADSANAYDGGKIPLFREDGGGVILRPGTTKLLCAKGGDSGGHCAFRWCSGHLEADYTAMVKSWDFPGDGCGPQGQWKPQDIDILMQRQTAWQLHNHRLQYNEFIVDGDEWARTLPGTIEAFFMINGHGGEGYQAFLDAYGLHRGQVPLVVLDPNNWQAPFSDPHSPPPPPTFEHMG